jgi:hypothetical protein
LYAHRQFLQKGEKKMMRRVLFGIVPALLAAQLLLSVGADETFARPRLVWDPSPGTVSGYVIYYGRTSDGFSYSVDVGRKTEYSLDRLALRSAPVYCFTVTAYNGRTESDCSNSVCWIADDSLVLHLPTYGSFGKIPESDPEFAREVNFSFEGKSRDFLVEYEAYDIDSSDELEISVNGWHIGYAPKTANNSWGRPPRIKVHKEYVNDNGPNILTFTNTRNWKWAVRDVEVH